MEAEPARLVQFAGIAVSLLVPLGILIAIHQARHCPRPRKRLRRSFYLALLATGVTVVISSIVISGGASQGDELTVAEAGAAAWRVLPMLVLLEELSRFVVLAGYSLRHRAQPAATDGILYGLAAGLTFALMENALVMGGSAMGTAAVGWLRTAMATPLHGLLGALMGHLVARARSEGRNAVVGLLLALVVPTAVHFLYDTPVVLTISGGAEGLTIQKALATFAVNIGVNLALLWLVVRLYRRARRETA